MSAAAQLPLAALQLCVLCRLLAPPWQRLSQLHVDTLSHTKGFTALAALCCWLRPAACCVSTHTAAKHTNRACAARAQVAKSQFCDQQLLLLVNFAYSDRFAWRDPAGSGTGAPAAAAPDRTNATAQQQQQLPPAVTSRLGSGYTSSLPVRYINSTFVCQQPSAACADAPSNGTRSACLLAAYVRLDPDAAAGAGGGAAGGAPGRNYGVSVVLPAVLASVGECFQPAAVDVCQLLSACQCAAQIG